MGLFGLFKSAAEVQQATEQDTQRQESERQRQKMESLEFALGRLFDSLKDAVKSSNVEQVRLLGQEIQDNRKAQEDLRKEWGWCQSESEVRWYEDKRYYQSTPYCEIKKLVGDAVYLDNVAIFSALCDIFSFDVNDAGSEWLLTHANVHGFNHFKGYIPLIHFAIHERKANVALALAKDPRLDIHAEWEAWRQTVWTSSGSQYMVADREITPLVLARERGLKDVVLALASRELEFRRDEVAHLEQEIKSLSQPAAAAPAAPAP